METFLRILEVLIAAWLVYAVFGIVLTIRAIRRTGRQERQAKSYGLVPLTKPPTAGDIVYHENHGLVKYRVNDNYRPLTYPELVTVTVIEDRGDGYFEPGHESVRQMNELLVEAKIEV